MNELKNFDNLMPNHVILGKDATYWDKCWSSLWVHAFLIHQMTPQNRSLTLTKNMEAVPCPPFFAVIDVNKKKLVIAKDDLDRMKYLYKKVHSKRLGGDETFGPKTDKWKNFLEKVKGAQRVVWRLCNADVFPTKTLKQLETAVLCMSPFLSKLSCNGFCGGTDGKIATRSLSDDIIKQVYNNIGCPVTIEKLVCQHKKLIQKEMEQNKSKKR